MILRPSFSSVSERKDRPPYVAGRRPLITIHDLMVCANIAYTAIRTTPIGFRKG